MKNYLKLSPSALDRLAEGKYFDPEIVGLFILVDQAGRKGWIYRRRVIGTDTVVRLKLGNFPAFSIAAAREWAMELNQDAERGKDPRARIRSKKARGLTVEQAHLLYMEVMHRGDRKILKPRTLYDKQVIFDRDIRPQIGRKRLVLLTEDECWDVVYAKSKASKVRANKLAGELSCFLRWCSGREGHIAGIGLKAHPAPTLNSNWFATGPIRNKRYLSVEEIGWFFRALVEEPHLYRRALCLLLLTAARRTELFELPASEIVDGLWTLPAERSKNGEPNYVALAPWGQRLSQTNHEWVFPSPRVDGPQRNGWFKSRDRVHARMEKFAGERLARWHFHDLRRTFRSHARRVGIERDIAEMMLNHKKKGLEAIYDQNDELELRADGFARWERSLVEIAEEMKVAGFLGVPYPYPAAPDAEEQAPVSPPPVAPPPRPPLRQSPQLQFAF
ncbi:hypothetical protein CVO77_04215 [Sphingopyxis lindanitolerans]|uniref:Tyr recombinase domain-containing protein n=1 Tax=Sphingopyxis lindanitolerans TaxID=2054227 RepID=A0A2S8B5Z5_9SPHN|nr:hypothetical protein CVO77_04215 [Sphingopyxis lindanitolerans]